jgi:hypothetical protein
VLSNVSEALNSGVLGFNFLHGSSEILLGKIKLHVSASSSLKDDRMNIAPALDVFKFVSLGEDELLGEFNFVCFFIKAKEALRHDSGGVEDSSEGRSEKMTLLSSEGWVRVDFGIQVTGEDVLNLASLLNVNWVAVWELDPVVKKVVGHPENSLVESLSTRLNRRVLRVFLSLRESTNGDPEILLGTEDLASKSKGLSATHDSQSLLE